MIWLVITATPLLFLLQPAKSMNLLQEELDVTLFCAVGRGLKLTEEGHRIYQKAKAFLIFLLPLITQLAKHSLKSKQLNLLELNFGQIEEMVQKRQLDYGITYVPHPMNDVEHIEVGQFSPGCYYLNPAFASMPNEEIPFVVPTAQLAHNPLDIHTYDGWSDTFFIRNKQYKVNLLSTALELTLAGLCAVYIPDFIASKINTALPRNKQITTTPFVS